MHIYYIRYFLSKILDIKHCLGGFITCLRSDFCSQVSHSMVCDSIVTGHTVMQLCELPRSSLCADVYIINDIDCRRGFC